MGKPGFFFYTGDWLKDTKVLPLAVRGAWIDLLCILHENDGEITWRFDDLSSFWAVSSADCPAFVRLLSRLNTADVTFVSQDVVTISCRKMKRAVLDRENARLRKEKERDRKRKERAMSQASHADVHPPLLNPSLNPSLNLKNPDPPTAAPTVDFASNGKPGGNSPKPRIQLDPRIKVAADKIYMTDPKRYARLIVWITAGLQTYSPPVIAQALEKFEPYCTEKMDWWPYLNTILDKTEGQTNARDAEAESENYKREEREFIEKMQRRR